MAGVISLNAFLRVNNSIDNTFYFNKTNIVQTVLGGGGPGTIEIGTAEEDIVTEVSSEGWCWIQNADATNTVLYGPKSAGAMVTFGLLKPGEGHPFRLSPGVVIRAKSNVAACKVQIAIFED